LYYQYLLHQTTTVSIISDLKSKDVHFKNKNTFLVRYRKILYFVALDRVRAGGVPNVNVPTETLLFHLNFFKIVILFSYHFIIIILAIASWGFHPQTPGWAFFSNLLFKAIHLVSNLLS